MNEPTDTSGSAMHATLFANYGPLIGSPHLSKVLGYTSPAAFRQALLRKQIPIKVFEIQHRRGKFALTLDVSNWLASVKPQTYK